MATEPNAIPEWRCVKDTMINSTLWLEGSKYMGSLARSRVKLSDVEPLNEAARESLRNYISGPQRPRWRATQRLEVDGKIVAAGHEFHSVGWPRVGWEADNSAAELVLAYRREHPDEALPSTAWDVDAARVNTIEADAARRAPPAPPEDPRPEYPMSGPIPKGAIGFRPRRDQPSNFTPSTSPSA